MTSPVVGLLALVALVLWYRARRRRHRVPGGPIIHRDRLERAEREVRRMPADRGRMSGLPGDPTRPRPPIHL